MMSFVRSATVSLMMFMLLGTTAATLKVDVFPNCALHGAASTTTAPSLDFQVNMGGSAEVTGTLTYDETAYVAFECSFGGGQLVFVWVADHLVCHTNPPFGNTPSSTDGSPQYPLQTKKGDVAPIVIHVYSYSDEGYWPITSEAIANVTVRWAKLAAPLHAGATPSFASVPTTAITPDSPEPELKRRQLQKALKTGWNLWTYNLLDVVRLPQSFALSLALCKLSTQKCLTEARIEGDDGGIRVGPFAVDQSYLQLYVAHAGLNVSISATGGSGTLHLLIEPLGCASPHPEATLVTDSSQSVNCSDYALVVAPRYVWFRAGNASTTAQGGFSLTPFGMPVTAITPTRAPDTNMTIPIFADRARLAFGLGSGAVGLREGVGSPSLSAVSTVVSAARAKELSTYSYFGSLSDVKEGLQAATLWNYIYTPAEYGPILPVSRSWNFVKQSKNTDWAYVIFDWDNFFASYMTSLDPVGKDIAYSNLIQVVRSRTARGFVPNYSAGGSKSVDRTEPPIGAKVLLEMYNKYKDTWLIELLLDDLITWNDWLLSSRTLGPLGLISLGSDTIDGYKDYSAGAMQGARFESGLDNSPMYDGSYFNKSVIGDGSFSVGQMELYDVGFASMFVQEAECLASLARVLGRTEEDAKLTKRAADQRALISAHLWDVEGGIFTNKWWNGSFYRRITPTSFYPLMAKAATDTQAEVMMRQWLLSPEHFCIAPDGDFKGNSDDCYWGLPSIQKADPAFPPLGYWRGYVWGPMAALTYWSLQAYDHVPIVRGARKALCKQMTALMLSQWRAHRHICENFSPHKTADDHQGDCSGTKFYHWGALTGMITLIEEGFY